MDVFISWSGDRSKALAQALSGWLPDIVQALTPWISSESLSSGVRWTPSLTQRLEATNFGILAITPVSLGEPWLLYEAGALSKLSDAKVVPVVLGVSKAIPGPLGQFQARDTSKGDLLALCRDLNEASGKAVIPEGRLVDQFERCWPGFEAALAAVEQIDEPMPHVTHDPVRSDPGMIEEILLRVRDLQRGPLPSSNRELRAVTDLVVDIASFDGTAFEIETSPKGTIVVKYSAAIPQNEPSEAVRRAIRSLSKLIEMPINWRPDPNVPPF